MGVGGGEDTGEASTGQSEWAELAGEACMGDGRGRGAVRRRGTGGGRGGGSPEVLNAASAGDVTVAAAEGVEQGLRLRVVPRLQDPCDLHGAWRRSKLKTLRRADGNVCPRRIARKPLV
jgi:hypothetical protein